MSSAAQRTQDAFIHEARELLKPIPVGLPSVPNWLRLKMLKAFGCPDRATDGHSVLWHAISKTARHGRWVDHFGSSELYGRPAFVSEPYDFSAGTAQDVSAFCDPMGLRWVVCSNSYWFPGRTIRIAIYDPKEA